MTFSPSFKIGEIVTNEELYKEFSCGNSGGLRRSNLNNCLVIVCDHTKSLYDDKWYGNELHYTGMGKFGDQPLDKTQNKTLAESNTNGVTLFLFEVMNPGKYTYRGQVKLSGQPYQEKQTDEQGLLRNVWMFPLTTVEEQTISQEELDEYVRAQQDKAKSLSTDELKKQAKEHASNTGSSRTVKSKTYIRDSAIAEYTKRAANGVCDLCEQKAPFNDKNGNPYLESHHIVWLSKGGADTIENSAALCPNCHKKMHIVAAESDVEKLLKKAEGRA